MRSIFQVHKNQGEIVQEDHKDEMTPVWFDDSSPEYEYFDQDPVISTDQVWLVNLTSVSKPSLSSSSNQSEQAEIVTVPAVILDQ